jgi:membrane-bound serine protease (ClpP class)
VSRRRLLLPSARRIDQILLVTSGCLLAAPAVSAAQSPTVLAMRVDGTITPVVADRLEEELRVAERNGHEALLVEMDTPGGLLQSTREIVQDVLAFEVPVIVYVAPSGARAASAGAYIVLSAHVAATRPTRARIWS